MDVCLWVQGLTMQWQKIEAFLVDKIWGGSILALQKLGTSSRRIGESWEVSTLDEGQSRVAGKSLSEYLSGQLSYLIKILETTDHLSIQVHPPDYKGVRGKTECWLILDAKPNAGIYLGFKAGVTEQKLQASLKNKEDISQLLNFYQVAPGDFFYTPAGSVHAIGKDVLLLEVQQACGITYRLWDWNRLGDDGKPRSLHVEQAMSCLNFAASANTEKYFKRMNTAKNNGKMVLVEHEDFKFNFLQLSAGEKIQCKFNSRRPAALVVLQGGLHVGGLTLKKFESAVGNGESGNFELLASETGASVAWVE
jgi:mannose-6-phosphate isomerase